MEIPRPRPSPIKIFDKIKVSVKPIKETNKVETTTNKAILNALAPEPTKRAFKIKTNDKAVIITKILPVFLVKAINCVSDGSDGDGVQVLII
jgi:hypothetical protein